MRARASSVGSAVTGPTIGQATEALAALGVRGRGENASVDRVDTFLQRAGASADEIARAEAEGWLPLLVVDRLLVPGAPTYDLAALAREAGVGEEFARRVWRTMGFPDVPGDVPLFTDRDVDALRGAAGRITDATDVEAFLRQSRAIGAAMARVGAIDADVIADVVWRLREAGLGEREVAGALLDAIDWAGLATVLDHVHRIQARAAVWRRLTRDTLTELEIAIGFADLAGFTRLSAELEPDDLSDLLLRWEDVAYDRTAQHAGRVVKTIGDEVMFAGLGESVLGIALDIVDAAAADPRMPAVRVGVASGPVIARDGDYYGPVVNLASRLTEMADRGTVLASRSLHDEFGGDPLLEWDFTGPRHVRGIGDTEVFVVRRASGVSQGPVA